MLVGSHGVDLIPRLYVPHVSVSVECVGGFLSLALLATTRDDLLARVIESLVSGLTKGTFDLEKVLASGNGPTAV